MVGYVPYGEVDGYFRMADVFVCASQWEEPLGPGALRGHGLRAADRDHRPGRQRRGGGGRAERALVPAPRPARGASPPPSGRCWTTLRSGGGWATRTAGWPRPGSAGTGWRPNCWRYWRDEGVARFLVTGAAGFIRIAPGGGAPRRGPRRGGGRPPARGGRGGRPAHAGPGAAPGRRRVRGAPRRAARRAGELEPVSRLPGGKPADHPAAPGVPAGTGP